MGYIYIKELNKKAEITWFRKVPKCMQSFIWHIIKKYNFVLRKKIGEEKILLLVSNTEKCYRIITRKIEKEKIKTNKLQIVLSKKLKWLKDYLKGYKMLEGKSYFLNSLEGVLEKVLKENPLEMQSIYILTNKYSEQSIFLIKRMSPKVKSINIITKEIAKYMKLEEKVKEQGIAMSVANNKRKSLKNAKIIINVDFSKDEIEEYVIFRNALIVNLTQEKIKLKGFEGINIQDIEIKLTEEQMEWIRQNNLKEEFKQTEIYESILEEINQESLYILGLYGNSGKINEKELLNWQKILTN